MFFYFLNINKIVQLELVKLEDRIIIDGILVVFGN